MGKNKRGSQHLRRVPPMGVNGKPPDQPRPEIKDWDISDPPEFNECSRMAEMHSESCDGNCNKVTATELEIKLQNTANEFTRRGFVIQGVPASFKHVGIQGFHVELFDLQCSLAACIELLKETHGEDELQKRFQTIKLHKMTTALEQADKAAAAEKIVVAKNTLLGPNGNVIH